MPKSGVATAVSFFHFQLSLPFSRLSDALVESALRQPLRGAGPQPGSVVVVVLVDVVPTVAVVVVVVMLMDAPCTAKVQALACEMSTSSWTLPPPSSARAMHVVISDVMMPELSGDELVRAIRTHGELDEMLIVLLAAKADDALRVRLLREDAQDSLTENLLVDDDRLVRFRSATSSRPSATRWSKRPSPATRFGWPASTEGRRAHGG